jgi:hypothetical protein
MAEAEREQQAFRSDAERRERYAETTGQSVHAWRGGLPTLGRRR